MKTLIRIRVLGFVFLSLQSCTEKGTVSVQNNISSVKISNVKWNGTHISYSLLPGQTSAEVEVRDEEGTFPKMGNVTFTMSANNRSVYLETQEVYTLDADDNLLIVLDDATEITNPNQ